MIAADLIVWSTLPQILYLISEATDEQVKSRRLPESFKELRETYKYILKHGETRN